MVKDVYLVHVVRNSEAKAMIIFVGRKTTCVFVQLLLEVKLLEVCWGCSLDDGKELKEEVCSIHSGLKQVTISPAPALLSSSVPRRTGV